MANKNIIVTGAAGYIGGTFAYEALKKGYKVINFGRNEVSGLHLITVLPSKLDGAADRRREGKVVYLKKKSEK